MLEPWKANERGAANAEYCLLVFVWLVCAQHIRKYNMQPRYKLSLHSRLFRQRPPPSPQPLVLVLIVVQRWPSASLYVDDATEIQVTTCYKYERYFYFFFVLCAFAQQWGCNGCLKCVSSYEGCWLIVTKTAIELLT